MFAFLRFMSRLPLGLLHALGAFAGWLTWALSPTYRRRYAANVRRAGLTSAQARQGIANAGRMVAETPWLWLRDTSPLGARLQWQGAELIDAALAKGQGLLLLTPHLGCFEVCAQAYAERWGGANPITALYRPARKPWMQEVLAVSRDRPGLNTAPANLAGVRLMIRALRQGNCVGLLPDQVPPEGQGVWVPFFGEPAYTITLTGRLVQQTGAVPLLIWGERLPGAAGWRVHVEPAPVIDAEDSPETAALAVNQAMESLIKQAPGQYLWGYHRYKQPRGQDTGNT
ncbi:MAG TPA: lysophospholipid acyltransferase family protein [Burkholderiaceae bacterium]